MSTIIDSSVTEISWPKVIKTDIGEFDISDYERSMTPHKLTVTIADPVPCYVNAMRRGLICETPTKRLVLVKYKTQDIYLKADIIAETVMMLPIPDNIKVGATFSLSVANNQHNTRKEVYTTDIVDENRKPLKVNKMVLVDISTAKQFASEIMDNKLELSFVVASHSALELKFGGYQLMPTVAYDIDDNPMTLTAVNNGDGDIKKQWNYNIGHIIKRVETVSALFAHDGMFEVERATSGLSTYIFRAILRGETSTIAEMLKIELMASMPNDQVDVINYMQDKEDIRFRIIAVNITTSAEVCGYVVKACAVIIKKLKVFMLDV